ncbi:hypothetical protein SmJEL517_g01248 [Synchytrium microbalum]|uniref:LIM zinc-binding domain-containing protein n=1 Tax=Synchytrium microbalum TaxID=1806994 RepID=A0A507CGS0_9FUNG|nr:uncharacterized protein SmJEL517_g01248 [Synchytrium microbalum]TPX36723.1 hypothetical protein SmJEL517_g01248 [Synchytrium microbalum]
MEELDNLLKDLSSFTAPSAGPSTPSRSGAYPSSPAIPSQLDPARMPSPAIKTASQKTLVSDSTNIPSPSSNLNNVNIPSGSESNLARGNGVFGSTQSLAGGGKMRAAPMITNAPFQKADMPPCGGCRQPVDGQYIEAIGKHYHKDHFLCRCGRLLTYQKYIEKDGAAWCKKCFGEEFAPRCAYCSEPIHERAINALGKSFHIEHFFCCQCGKNFGAQEGFLEHEGKAYCEEDYLNLFAQKCNRCGAGLIGDYIIAMDAYWHQACFSCADCGVHFKDGKYYQINGVALCENHFYER